MKFFFLFLFLLVAVRLSVEQSLSYQITTVVNATNLPQWRLIENELDSMLQKSVKKAVNLASGKSLQCLVPVYNSFQASAISSQVQRLENLYEDFILEKNRTAAYYTTTELADTRMQEYFSRLSGLCANFTTRFFVYQYCYNRNVSQMDDEITIVNKQNKNQELFVLGRYSQSLVDYEKEMEYSYLSSSSLYIDPQQIILFIANRVALIKHSITFCPGESYQIDIPDHQFSAQASIVVSNHFFVLDRPYPGLIRTPNFTVTCVEDNSKRNNMPQSPGSKRQDLQPQDGQVIGNYFYHQGLNATENLRVGSQLLLFLEGTPQVVEVTQIWHKSLVEISKLTNSHKAVSQFVLLPSQFYFQHVMADGKSAQTTISEDKIMSISNPEMKKFRPQDSIGLISNGRVNLFQIQDVNVKAGTIRLSGPATKPITGQFIHGSRIPSYTQPQLKLEHWNSSAMIRFENELPVYHQMIDHDILRFSQPNQALITFNLDSINHIDYTFLKIYLTSSAVNASGIEVIFTNDDQIIIYNNQLRYNYSMKNVQFENYTNFGKSYWILVYDSHVKLGYGKYISNRYEISSLPYYNLSLQQVRFDAYYAANVMLSDLLVSPVNQQVVSAYELLQYKPPQIEKGNNSLILKVEYPNGDISEAEKIKRSAVVLHQCDEAFFRIVDVKEIAQCKYQITIGTNLLCNRNYRPMADLSSNFGKVLCRGIGNLANTKFDY